MTHEEASEKARRLSDTGEYHVYKTMGGFSDSRGKQRFVNCGVYIDGNAETGQTFEECFAKHEEK